MITKEYTIVTTQASRSSYVYLSILDESGIEIAGSVTNKDGFETHWGARRAGKRWLKNNAAPVDQRPAKVKKSKYIMKFEDHAS